MAELKTCSCVTVCSIWSQLTSFPSSQLETSFKALTEDTFPTGRETGNPIWRHSALKCSRSCFGAALFHLKSPTTVEKCSQSTSSPEAWTNHPVRLGSPKPDEKGGIKKQRLQFWLSAPGVNWIKQKTLLLALKIKNISPQIWRSCRETPGGVIVCPNERLLWKRRKR